MMPRCTVVVGMMLCLVALARAQEEGVVTGSGQVTLTKQPNLVRAEIQVLAKGEDLKQALAQLEQERSSARQKLVSLGAKEDSIEFAAARIGAAAKQTAAQQMMAMMRGGRTPKPAAEDGQVQVSSLLRVEWPLQAVDEQEALIKGSELREQIKQSFARTSEELTPEEQELLEEMQEDDDFSGMPMAKPGEPAIVFVHRLGDDEYQKATADAFAKARAAAQRLAAAAGSKLGAVRSLNSSFESVDDGNEDNYAMQFYLRAMGTSAGDGAGAAPEATASEPGPVQCRITVTASFALQ